MVKFFKRAWVLCLALCMALGICVAATACDSSPVEYTVTVTCTEDPNLLLLVKVQLMGKDGKAATEEQPLKNGSVSFTLDAGEYTVKLINSDIEAGKYTYPTTTLTKSNPDAAITVNRKQDTPPPPDDSNKVEYRIKVLDPSGNPVEGAFVQLCLANGFCVNPELTDENGIATLKLEPNVYQIHILEGTEPDGFTFNNEKYVTGENGGETIVRFEAAK